MNLVFITRKYLTKNCIFDEMNNSESGVFFSFFSYFRSYEIKYNVVKWRAAIKKMRKNKNVNSTREDESIVSTVSKRYISFLHKICVFLLILTCYFITIRFDGLEGFKIDENKWNRYQTLLQMAMCHLNFPHCLMNSLVESFEKKTCKTKCQEFRFSHTQIINGKLSFKLIKHQDATQNESAWKQT